MGCVRQGPVFSVLVLYSPSLSCILRPCSVFSVLVLYSPSLSCILRSCSVFSVLVLCSPSLSCIRSVGHSRERNVLFNDALSTFYLRLYGVRHMVKETRCRHIGYSYRLTARVLLYAPSHRQDNTYHGLCYTSRGALAGTRNSSMG